MARIRSIKPEFWTSEQIMNLSPLARLLFVGMWTHCDDGGNHPASARTLKAEVFPGDDFTTADVQGLVDAIVAEGLITVYQVDGKAYWHVTGWARHQRIEKPTYKHPAPPNSAPAQPPAAEASPTSPEPVAENSPTTPREVGDSSAPEWSGVDRSGEDVSPAPSGSDATTPSAKGQRRPRSQKTQLPEGFEVSDRVRSWAAEKGHGRLDEHLESFRAKCQARAYSYADWDAAFMEAIREDWAGLARLGAGRPASGPAWEGAR